MLTKFEKVDRGGMNNVHEPNIEQIPSSSKLLKRAINQTSAQFVVVQVDGTLFNHSAIISNKKGNSYVECKSKEHEEGEQI